MVGGRFYARLHVNGIFLTNNNIFLTNNKGDDVKMWDHVEVQNLPNAVCFGR